MTKLKNFILAISDDKRSRQERMFRLLVLIGMIGLTVGILSGIIIGESLENCIVMTIMLGVFFATTCYTVHNQKIQLGASIIGVIIIFLALPVNFLTTGGIYGGAPIWFLFGVVYVCLVIENKTKYFFLGSSIIICVVCYYISYFYPNMVISHTLDMAYTDSLFSLMIVSALTCGMILFQNKIFHSENAVAQKQKKEIEELNEMQNRFFSSMSHEIRTPINTIIGLNEMILREEVSDEVAADAKNIQNASKMLLALINDILDMSKIESGKMEIVPVVYDVGEMLSELVNMIWIRAQEKGLEFHINVDQAMPAQLFGDEVRIKQILINVLNNAVKYTKEGSVTLSIQCSRKGDGSALISYSITDTGIGIKKENIPYLFRAFKRLDEEKNRYIEGTGLGLSIVKQLVDLMDGEIAVNSVYLKGSTFVITLPQKTVGEAEIGELNMEMRHVMNARKYYKQSFEAPEAKVLIVDDNETNLMVAEKLLRDTKVQIDTALEGAECLKKTLEKHYDVILMDHFMPGMDGIECLRRIRMQAGGLNKDVPVVILTANAGGENQELYRREGFDGYLLKPVTGIQLETELLRHLPRKLVNSIGESGNKDALEITSHTYTRKTAVMITTDSVCDLPKHLVKKYKIAVMPYRVCTQGGEFLDGIETESDGVLAYIRDKGMRVNSEAPKMQDYEVFFAEQLTKAQYVVHISMAKNVSKGYENAVETAKIFDNVIVLDSGHLSSGMGLIVLRAAEYAAQGLTVDEIADKVIQMKTKTRTSFIVGSTEYLAMSGRISEKINTICKAFMLHPELVLKNSKMIVGQIQLGTKEYVWKKYIATALRNVDEIDTRVLFITYAGLSRNELKEIEECVNKRVAFETIIYQKASPAISINCGPGAFGLLYMMKI